MSSMFYQLPPVGNTVRLSRNAALARPSFLLKSNSRFYHSGTAALASAVIAAISFIKSQKEINIPEVILPAYGCPDLVSAVIYAGARVVLVDLEAEQPWLDLERLESAISDNTVAIVAVNLFGIAERWSLLRQLANMHGLLLIEDSAQYFPAGESVTDWQGNMVVFSFGRGKPVSLLGGGAVHCADETLCAQLPKTRAQPAGRREKLKFDVKAGLYNAMISPYLYWLPQSLPFLHLGETRYHTLQDIKAMDSVRSDLLSANITGYQNDVNATRRCQAISSMLTSLPAVTDLAKCCQLPASRRLLRYPVLLDKALRDWAYQKLKQAGLGPSIMYPASMPKIAGLESVLDNRQHFPQAEKFAARLLTLPVHSHVSQADIDLMGVILKEI